MERDTKIGLIIGVILACAMSVKNNGDFLSGFATDPLGSIVCIGVGYFIYNIFLIVKDGFEKKKGKEEPI